MIELVHAADQLEMKWKGRPLFTYVIAAEDPPYHGRRPYLHPVHSLTGDQVTECQPEDHPWHKGISMTCTVVNDQNFWGGPTFREGDYQPLDNVGQTRHEAWEEISTDSDHARLRHRLSWITARQEVWLSEQRMIDVSITPEGWVMDWRMELRNVSGQALSFGSPTTEGRPHAGYTGLFWRGTSAFKTGHVVLSDGRSGYPEAFMGSETRWLTFSSRQTSLVFEDCTEPRMPTMRWFVRNQEYTGVAFAFSYDEAIVLQPGDQLTLAHRIGILTSQPDGAQIEAWLARLRESR